MSDAGDLRDRLQPAIGSTYRIERELGGGGMSRVFVADEAALGRKVVVKVLVVGRMAADWVTQRLAETGLVEVVDSRSASLNATAVDASAAGTEAGRAPARRGGPRGGAPQGAPARVRALAEATGAGTVVWGSYYRDGDTRRFQARVTDAVRGEVLRSLEGASGPGRRTAR